MLNSYKLEITYECNRLTYELRIQKDVLLEEHISQMVDFRLDLYRASIFSLNLDNMKIC
jgi:hypothetical protein